jgi:hypothetical protein
MRLEVRIGEGAQVVVLQRLLERVWVSLDFRLTLGFPPLGSPRSLIRDDKFSVT